jgi:amino acid permease
MKRSLTTIGIVAAATIGSGLFALPYIIERSGWALSLGYFVALIAIISLAHILYLRTLGAVHERERLLGLAQKYFGAAGFWIGFLAVVIGLLLSFVAYLVLGERFIHIIFPGLPLPLALILFWLVIVILVFKSEGRIAILEMAGVALIFCAIFLIFIFSDPLRALTFTPLINVKIFFFPLVRSSSLLQGGPALNRFTRCGEVMRQETCFFS